MNNAGKPRILCVDDQPSNLKLLEATLGPKGYDVLMASDGVEVLDKIGELAPDLLLLDVMMPGMDGFELTRKLKSREDTKFLPIILVTALADTADRVKGIEVGCDDFISKPFDKHELLARVRSLLRIKSLHDKVETSYKKLKELELLKDSLTHMIVHDFSNPLANMLGFLYLLKMQSWDALSHDQQESLDLAYFAGQELQRMTGNLLDINKMTEGKMPVRREPFNIVGAAKEVIDQMMVLARAGNVNISIESPAEKIDILADKDLIRRVIANLVSNALKYTPSNGSVTVKISKDPDTGELNAQVIDTGEGIPEEYLDKIFDKFVRVESAKARSGRGLGLTFCKMAVEAHGGRIRAASEPGSGSVFTFTIPGKA